MAKVSIPTAAPVDENTVVPKPRGNEALKAYRDTYQAPKAEGEVLPAETIKPIVTGSDTVMVLCKENARYRYGTMWITLIKNKKISLPIEAAKYYRTKGKVDF
jgi:hypothetical protein